MISWVSVGVWVWVFGFGWKGGSVGDLGLEGDADAKELTGGVGEGDGVGGGFPA